MNYFNKIIKEKLGIDGAIFFTSLFRILQSFGGLISILFVAKYLTDVEQGFYYTFGSIIAIQVFFELGLNGIITQYVAHEVSNLEWIDKHTLNGESKYLSRVSSLLHFSVKWYLIFALLLFIIILCLGFSFFNNFYDSEEVIHWESPWVILSIFTSFNLLVTPIYAFLQGLGKVKEVARIRLIQQTIVYIAIYIGFFFGFKLFVPAIQSITLFVLGVILIYLFKYHKILIKIWNFPITEKVNYYKEIFPFQWKIAISWISGYFIYQLFNPILFAFEGAVIAGQMGMTLAILNGVQALSNSWMTTKIPKYSGLIAQRNFTTLDSLFKTTLKQSVFINFTALLLLFSIVEFIRFNSLSFFGLDIISKILPNIPLLFLMLSVFINQFVFSWALYLRCHKKEPFLSYSVVMAVLVGLSTFFMTKFYGVNGMTFGYFAINLALFYWAYYIFKTKKLEWHE